MGDASGDNGPDGRRVEGAVVPEPIRVPPQAADARSDVEPPQRYIRVPIFSDPPDTKGEDPEQELFRRASQGDFLASPPADLQETFARWSYRKLILGCATAAFMSQTQTAGGKKKQNSSSWVAILMGLCPDEKAADTGAEERARESR